MSSPGLRLQLTAPASAHRLALDGHRSRQRTALESVSCSARSFERFDGKGGPNQSGGSALPRTSRVVHLATICGLYHQSAGPERALDVARSRSGGHFDPEIVEALHDHHAQIFEPLAQAAVWDLATALPPADDCLHISPEEVCRAFADFVDIKSVYTLGYSSRVAARCKDAARHAGLDEHRTSHTPESAREILQEEVGAGRQDHRAVSAVLEAAGQRPPSPPERPANLSEREVEVLALIASAHSNKEIAKRLFISAKTVQHHVAHIYAKADLCTRVGAALFAIEHDLLPR